MKKKDNRVMAVWIVADVLIVITLIIIVHGFIAQPKSAPVVTAVVPTMNTTTPTSEQVAEKTAIIGSVASQPSSSSHAEAGAKTTIMDKFEAGK